MHTHKEYQWDMMMYPNNPGALEAEAELPGLGKIVKASLKDGKREGGREGKGKRENPKVRDWLKDTCSCQG